MLATRRSVGFTGFMAYALLARAHSMSLDVRRQAEDAASIGQRVFRSIGEQMR